MSALGNAIKILRANARLSLQDVADRAALSKAHIWEIETGNTTNVTIRSICCIAVALDIEADQLAAAAITDVLKTIRVETSQHKFVMPAPLSSGMSSK